MELPFPWSCLLVIPEAVQFGDLSFGKQLKRLKTLAHRYAPPRDLAHGLETLRRTKPVEPTVPNPLEKPNVRL
jgi:hypothetical protein